MITYSIRGENIEVTDSLRAYVESKISKLDKYFTQDLTAHVNLKVYSDHKNKVEVTIPAKNVTLRAEDMSQDMYSSIDLVEEKLERQIRKYKTRTNRKSRDNIATSQVFTDEFAPLAKPDELNDEVKIVRTKHVDLKPMDAEEALLQMEALGHDFYVFTDSDDQSTSIVYRREDGNLGLIETK